MQNRYLPSPPEIQITTLDITKGESTVTFDGDSPVFALTFKSFKM